MKEQEKNCFARCVTRRGGSTPCLVSAKVSCDTCTWPILAEVRDCSQSHCHCFKGGSIFALFDSVVSFLRLNEDYLTNRQNRLVYGRKSSSHWRKRNGFVDQLLCHKDLCLNTVLASFTFHCECYFGPSYCTYYFAGSRSLEP